jgi:hypothetical protein
VPVDRFPIWANGRLQNLRQVLLMLANYRDTLCAFLRLKLTPHPAFGTPLPMGEGIGGEGGFVTIFGNYR